MKPTSKTKSKPFQKFYKDEKPKKKESFKVRDDSRKEQRSGSRRDEREDTPFAGKRNAGRKDFDGTFKKEGSFEKRPGKFGQKFESRDGDRKSFFSGDKRNGAKRSFEGRSGREDSFEKRPGKFESRDGDRKSSFSGDKRNGGKRSFEGRSGREDSFEKRPGKFGQKFESRDGDRKSSFSGDKRSGGRQSFDGRSGREDSFEKRPGKFGQKFESRDGDRKSSFSGDKRGGGKRSFEGRSGREDSFEKRPGKFGQKFESRDGDRKPSFSGDKRRSDREFSGKDFKEKGSFENKAKRPGKKPNLRRFDEEDLSFGRKRDVEKIIPEESAEPEVTFTKELEDKWQQEMPRPSFEPKKGRPSERTGKRHDHAPKKKDFDRYFDEEEETEMVYTARGSKKKVGSAHLQDEENDQLDGDLMPLNKYIAHCDVCGRREAAQLVKEGKVKVNGELITEPGHKVSEEDKVTLSGKKLQLQANKVYILLNKPKGFITTTDDPKGRRTVMDIFVDHIEERIFPIGRLDRNTTGLLLMTNDGDLAQKLAHPSNEIKKVYQVSLDKALSEADFDKIKAGVVLDDGPASVDQIAYLNSKLELGLEIHNGKNRIVRRIFESLGYVVEKLDRVMYAGLTKKQVPRGQWRTLTKQEIINLKHFNKS